jgi:hypothetical protein
MPLNEMPQKSEIHITKAVAARRQLNAAVRMLFSGEDGLAVHTLVAAAHTILVDLDGHRSKSTLSDAYSTAFERLIHVLKVPHPGEEQLKHDLPAFKELIQRLRRKPANFLKHADRDSHASLDENKLRTEDLLLEACVLYRELGFDLTPEMQVYGRWHLAVYPRQESDKINTDIGLVHELSHDTQLQLGAFLLHETKGQSIADQL